MKQTLLKNTGYAIYWLNNGKVLIICQKCATKKLMEKEQIKRIVAYWQITENHCIAKLTRNKDNDDNGIIEDRNTMSLQLGAFILSNSRRILKKFVLAIDAFKNDKGYYTDIGSVYIERTYCKCLKQNNLVGQKITQRKIW